MKKRKNLPTIRSILAAMERDVEVLRSRIGTTEVRQWEDKTRKEQEDELLKRWPEIIRLWKGLRYLQAKIGRIGRQEGDRVKLKPEMIRRIRTNKRTSVSALARELGVSRQTIYNVLKRA